MGFRNPITTATDPVARQAAAQAQSTANTALSVANGKNTTYISATTPVAPAAGFANGDQWIDTSAAGPRLQTWTGSAWAVTQWGTGSIASGAITAGLIAAGTITAAQIAAGAITAAKIAAGAIDGTTINGVTVTAGTLDTGTATTGPGVKLYQKAGNPASGIVEWRTGTMDAGGNATATLTGGGSGGSSFALQGGATQLTSAPQLQLNVEALPGGGYGPVMRLTAGAGGQIIPDGLITSATAILKFSKAQQPSIYTGAAFQAWVDKTGNSTSPYGAPELYVNSAGMVVCEGLFAAVGAVTAGTALVCTLPQAYWPRKQLLRGTIANGSAASVDIKTNGQILYSAGPSLAAGAYLAIDMSWLAIALA